MPKPGSSLKIQQEVQQLDLSRRLRRNFQVSSGFLLSPYRRSPVNLGWALRVSKTMFVPGYVPLPFGSALAKESLSIVLVHSQKLSTDLS